MSTDKSSIADIDSEAECFRILAVTKADEIDWLNSLWAESNGLHQAVKDIYTETLKEDPDYLGYLELLPDTDHCRSCQRDLRLALAEHTELSNRYLSSRGRKPELVLRSIVYAQNELHPDKTIDCRDKLEGILADRAKGEFCNDVSCYEFLYASVFVEITERRAEKLFCRIKSVAAAPSKGCALPVYLFNQIATSLKLSKLVLQCSKQCLSCGKDTCTPGTKVRRSYRAKEETPLCDDIGCCCYGD